MSRIIIITGASSGIGESFARRLIKRNADKMFLIARRADRLEALTKELSAKTKMQVVPVVADISGLKGKDIIKKIIEPNAVIDTLINNAGFGIYGLFGDESLERYSEMLDVNIKSVVTTCYSALPFLTEGSRIINVASLAAFSPMGAFALYAASKAFVLNFSLGLAAELSPKKIRVIALCPGPVDTEFSNIASNGIRKNVPHGASPNEVVEHCLRELDKGKEIAIMRHSWKIKALLARIVPITFLARLALRFERRPSAKGE
ncbi:MAG: SDR family NAD(P)-dependent oxidoreductase [Deltaproteobacteria bacterium]|jgi:short-subunit dehydrogenase|nr:SDR family NAD(P)-dependent oxidoreductase [Deltaproteobacteria bacterium]